MATRPVHDGFTERLKQALEESGYSGSKLKELGVLFGVSAQAVKKWLDGEAIPTAERAPSVAEKLGVRRAWLIDNEEPMRSVQGAVVDAMSSYAVISASVSLSSAEYKLLSQYRLLPHALQIDIAKLIADFQREVAKKTKGTVGED
jgi:transcriptional regulator with XRE-family HTH domain